MKKIVILLVVFFVHCRNNDNQKASENYFKTEIEGRIQKIKDLKITDSLAIDPKKIDEEVNKLVLLSKDVENLNACINKSKLFFDTISVKLQINKSDFISIGRGMTLEEIATALKSNELNIFNQILFKNNKGENLMYTAQ